MNNKPTRSEFLEFARPLIDDDDLAHVVTALQSGWLTTGPLVAEFERLFAEAVGATAALAVNSGTAALHLALLALGVGPGDAVISTPLTFCSTAHVVEHTGARLLLADIDPSTLNISVAEVHRILRAGSHNVRAIIVVHYAGLPCAMSGLLKLASDYNIALIEDAAHALPSRYQGTLIGSTDLTAGLPDATPSIRRAVAFSFYATKTVATGEGGMLVGDRQMIEDARVWSLHGMSRDAWNRYSGKARQSYEVDRAGFKYNMSDLQGSLGISQLAKLHASHQRRQQIAKMYSEGLTSLPAIELPSSGEDGEHSWHLYPIRLRLATLRTSRDNIIAELQDEGIGTSVHFTPIHMLSYYRRKYDFTGNAFPHAAREFLRLISLPIYPLMTDTDVADVILALEKVLADAAV